MSGASAESRFVPFLIAWEITRSCILHCRHCRAVANDGPYPGELSTEESRRVLDSIAARWQPIIILTGGEPLMRPDIWEIARYGTDLGLRMVMATCGTMITKNTVSAMKRTGIRRVSISLDGATATSHDTFRGMPGAFDKTLAGIAILKSGGIPFQVNTTITRHNLDELPDILDLTIKLGAAAFHPFLLVPTGRGSALAGEEISPVEYERVLNWFYDMQDQVSIPFKPTCAPHYHRILRQRDSAIGKSRQKPIGHPGQLQGLTKGCMGGQTFAFISHTGILQICGFLDLPCGDLRKVDYDFPKLWDESPVFREMRDWDKYHGKCGICEYRKVCGGCRARAFASTGDYLAEEPDCIYQPASSRSGASDKT